MHKAQSLLGHSPLHKNETDVYNPECSGTQNLNEV